MTPKEVSQELRRVQEKHKNVVTPTFSICISDMAKDAADTIDELQAFVDMISTLSTCNNCHRASCEYKPQWGGSVRYNCPLYVKGESNEI